jgi:hypothetical protein
MLRTPSKTEAGQAHLFSNSGSGRTLELGRSRRSIMRPPAPARRELRGRLGQQPDRQIRRTGPRVPPLYPLTRARGPRRPERGRPAARPAGAACWPPSEFGLGAGAASVRLTRAGSSCARRARRSDQPAGAGWAALRQFRLSDIAELGRLERSIMRRRGAGRALRGRGYRQTGGIERSAP